MTPSRTIATAAVAALAATAMTAAPASAQPALPADLLGAIQSESVTPATQVAGLVGEFSVAIPVYLGCVTVRLANPTPYPLPEICRGFL